MLFCEPNPFPYVTEDPLLNVERVASEKELETKQEAQFKGLPTTTVMSLVNCLKTFEGLNGPLQSKAHKRS